MPRLSHVGVDSMRELDEGIGDKVWRERSLRSYFEKVMESMGVWAVGADAEGAAPDCGWWGYWRLLATEVLLRHCRDILQARAGAIAACLADGGHKLDLLADAKDEASKKYIGDQKMKLEKFRSAPMETIEKCKKNATGASGWWTLEDDIRFLKNLGMRNVEFFEPLMSMEEWMECSWHKTSCKTPQEWGMKHQLMERKMEIFDIMKISAFEARDHVVEMKEYLMEDMPALMWSMWKQQNESGRAELQN